VPEDQIGKEHLFSTEKLGIVLAIFKYPASIRRSTSSGDFRDGGRGHSCGIYSFDDEHVHRWR
jgi:sulfoacetaldehyde dehydrogenase